MMPYFILLFLMIVSPSTLLGSTESPPLPDTLTVASVQMEVTSNRDANLERILRGIHEAAQAGARVVVFPETALSGFDEETVKGIHWPELGEAMERVADAAREARVYVIYGCATLSKAERPYNSAVIVGPDGQERTRYHKSFPEKWFEPGDHVAFFEIDGVPCTVIVCHDNRFPELVRIPTMAGAQVCFYISYEINDRESAYRKKEGYRAQSIARAVENGIWYVQSNGIGPLGREHLSLGNSVIVKPNGEVAAQAPELKDHMMVYTLRLPAGRGNALEGLKSHYLGDWWSNALQQMEAWNRGESVRAEPKSEGPDRMRLALMQSVPEKWNVEKNFNTFLGFLDEAKDADIFITPEGWLDGYASPDPASTPERLRSVAQDLESSPYLQRVGEEARKRKMHICFGFTSLEQGKVYNAAGLWDDKGVLLGVYHKTHLQEHDLQYAPGDDLPVFQTQWGSVGTMICADRRWPETARVLRLKGSRLILNPTYGMHGLSNEWWMRTRGYENQCFVAFAHPEVGFVVSPKGKLIAKRADKPGVLLCDIDLSEARSDENHLRDRRPELYGIIAEPQANQEIRARTPSVGTYGNSR